MSFTLIYITNPSVETAENIAHQLLEKKLVACANIFPISSVYWWQGNIESDKEVVLIVKTSNKLLPKVSQFVTSIHPYTTPCILYWQVNANPEYETWIQEQVLGDIL